MMTLVCPAENLEISRFATRACFACAFKDSVKESSDEEEKDLKSSLICPLLVNVYILLVQTCLTNKETRVLHCTELYKERYGKH